MTSQDDLESVMNEFVAAGVSEVAYTEFDVKFDSLPYDDAGLEQQAQDYTTVIKACLNVEACVGWTIWDWTDKYSVSSSLIPPLPLPSPQILALCLVANSEFFSGCQTPSPARAEPVYMMKALSRSQPSIPSRR